MLDLGFVTQLNKFLDLFPDSSVESLYRSVKHNAAVGGAMASGHRFGKAADLIFDDKARLIEGAERAIVMGFGGIEIDLFNYHLHLDTMARVWHVALIGYEVIDGKKKPKYIPLRDWLSDHSIGV